MAVARAGVDSARGRRIAATSAIAVVLAACCILSALDRAIGSGRQVPRLLQAIDFGAVAPRQAMMPTLSRGDAAAADRLAIRAVSRDPVHPRAAAVLGTARRALGDEAGARAAFAVAAQLGWRDPTTQLYWLYAAGDAGRPDVMANHADALLRTGSAAGTARDALAILETTDEGRHIVARHLAANPAWSRDYVAEAPALPPDMLARRIATMSLARPQGMTVDCAAIAGAAGALTAEARYAAAAALWYPFCRPGGRSRVQVDDGGFERVATDGPVSPFAWQVMMRGDLEARPADAPPGGAGQALYVRSTSAAEAVAARQFLMLPPGLYRFAWNAIGEDGGGFADIGLRLTCGDRWPPLPATRIRSDGGHRYSVAIEVPETDCPAQRLAITVAPSPSPHGGYVDDVTLLAPH